MSNQGPTMKKQKHNQVTSHIPSHIIDEIMLYLPLKSLVRFKLVSKHWFNQITDDSAFARTHYLKHQYVSSFIIHCIEGSKSEIAITDMKEVGEVWSYLLPKTLYSTSFDCLLFENCCDGILCASFHYDTRVLLWNPMTNWYKTVPLLSPWKIQQDGLLYGLGYDSSVKDYKLVTITSTHVEVMSLKSTSWRKIDRVFRCAVGYHDSTVHLNGTLYWLANSKNTSFDFTNIISFDLTKETLSIVQKPQDLKHYGCYSKLASFQNMLYLMCSKSKHDYEIRVMKEENNWVKLFKATVLGPLGYPVCCTNEAAIFARHNSLLIIDGEKGTTKEIKNYSGCDVDAKFRYWDSTVGYIGSLISPKVFNENDHVMRQDN